MTTSTTKRRPKKSTARPATRRKVDWSWSKNGKPDKAILADIVERIVRAAQPEKIVLFGSAARGEMGPDSDYDLLVIKGGKFNYWRVSTNIYRSLHGCGAPVDIVLVTAEDAERYRDTHCLVICPALKEGKIVYDSEAPAAGRSAGMAEPCEKQLGPRAGRKSGRVV